MVRAVVAGGQIKVTEEELDIWEDGYMPESASKAVCYATYLLEQIDTISSK